MLRADCSRRTDVFRSGKDFKSQWSRKTRRRIKTEIVSQINDKSLQKAHVDLQKAYRDFQNTYLDLQKPYLRLQKWYLDLQKPYLELQNTYRALQKAYFGLRKPYFKNIKAAAEPVSGNYPPAKE